MASWTYAHLRPEQLELLEAAEHDLGDDIVIAFAPSAWGDVDPDAVEAGGLEPDDLEPTQLERLRRLERDLDSVVVAYRRAIEPTR